MGIVILQSLIYMISVKRHAESAGMSQKEVNRAFRAGGIAALGPSVAVVIVAIALLPLFATPAVLTRVGLIGSAATEVASASLASETMGAQLGSENYTVPVFVVALTAMRDRKSTRLNSSHVAISYAVFCLKKKMIYLDYRVFECYD